MHIILFSKMQRQRVLTWSRCFLYCGFVVLIIQIWARIFLPGHLRQSVEETLRPFPVLFVAPLLWSSAAAFFHRKRLFGSVALLVGILSVLISLLPILLNEGVYD